MCYLNSDVYKQMSLVVAYVYIKVDISPEKWWVQQNAAVKNLSIIHIGWSFHGTSEERGYKVLGHPPYSSNLSPSVS